jgi:hypothetical protein
MGAGFLGVIVTLAAGIFWQPRRPPQPTALPVAPPTAPAVPTAPTPQRPPIEPIVQAPALVPPVIASQPPKLGPPVVPAKDKPAAPRTTCSPVPLPATCTLSVWVNPAQREQILDRLNDVGAVLCPGDSLLFVGPPSKPHLKGAPAYLSKDLQQKIAFGLRGIFTDHLLPFDNPPSQLRIKCPRP